MRLCFTGIWRVTQGWETTITYIVRLYPEAEGRGSVQRWRRTKVRDNYETTDAYVYIMCFRRQKGK